MKTTTKILLIGVLIVYFPFACSSPRESIAEEERWAALEEEYITLTDGFLEEQINTLETVLNNKSTAGVARRQCARLRNVRNYRLTLGNIKISAEDGKPLEVDGLELSRTTISQIAADFILYRGEIYNLCMLRNRAMDQEQPNYEFITYLQEESRALLEDYNKLKLGLTKAENEAEVLIALAGGKATKEKHQETTKALKDSLNAQ